MGCEQCGLKLEHAAVAAPRMFERARLLLELGRMEAQHRFGVGIGPSLRRGAQSVRCAPRIVARQPCGGQEHARDKIVLSKLGCVCGGLLCGCRVVKLRELNTGKQVERRASIGCAEFEAGLFFQGLCRGVPVTVPHREPPKRPQNDDVAGVGGQRLGVVAPGRVVVFESLAELPRGG